jgi:hypothetical protein
MTEQPQTEGEMILYRTANNTVRVEVLYESETFWLNQNRMAELFGVELPTISYHLKEIYGRGELLREATLRKILRVRTEGNREVIREIAFYNKSRHGFNRRSSSAWAKYADALRKISLACRNSFTSRSKALIRSLSLVRASCLAPARLAAPRCTRFDDYSQSS